MKNALIPLITILGPQIPNLITGTIFVELIFRVNGLGKFFVSSVALRDYPMIMATMLLVATLWSVTYLLSDLMYTVVDPRVRLWGQVTTLATPADSGIGRYGRRPTASTEQPVEGRRAALLQEQARRWRARGAWSCCS